jgi:hypothetical protein
MCALALLNVELVTVVPVALVLLGLVLLTGKLSTVALLVSLVLVPVEAKGGCVGPGVR